MSLTENLLKYLPVERRSKLIESVEKGLVDFLEDSSITFTSEVRRSLQDIYKQNKLGYKIYSRGHFFPPNIVRDHFGAIASDRLLLERLKLKGINSKRLRDATLDYLREKYPNVKIELKMSYEKSGGKGWGGKVFYKREEDLKEFLEENSESRLIFSFRM